MYMRISLLFTIFTSLSFFCLFYTMGKRCSQCSYRMGTADTHALCFTCLGTSHDCGSCDQCGMLSLHTFKQRVLRVVLWRALEAKAGEACPAPPAKLSLADYSRRIEESGCELPPSFANISLQESGSGDEAGTDVSAVDSLVESESSVIRTVASKATSKPTVSCPSVLTSLGTSAAVEGSQTTAAGMLRVGKLAISPVRKRSCTVTGPASSEAADLSGTVPEGVCGQRGGLLEVTSASSVVSSATPVSLAGLVGPSAFVAGSQGNIGSFPYGSGAPRSSGLIGQSFVAQGLASSLSSTYSGAQTLGNFLGNPSLGTAPLRVPESGLNLPRVADLKASGLAGCSGAQGSGLMGQTDSLLGAQGLHMAGGTTGGSGSGAHSASTLPSAFPGPITPALMADMIGIQVEAAITRLTSRLGLAPGVQPSGSAPANSVSAQQQVPVARTHVPIATSAVVPPQAHDVSMSSEPEHLEVPLGTGPEGEMLSGAQALGTSPRVGGQASSQYLAFLKRILPLSGEDGLIHEEASPQSILQTLAGIEESSSTQWGLDVPPERLGELAQAFKSPRDSQRSLTDAHSIFRWSPQGYSQLAKAPVVNDYLRRPDLVGSPLPVPHTKVESFARRVGRLFEVCLGTVRLAFHQSLLLQSSILLLPENSPPELQESLKYMARSVLELSSMASGAAGHSVALQRAMTLAPYKLNERMRDKIMAQPFLGTDLFGPDLDSVLQSEAELAKADKQVGSIFIERPKKSSRQDFAQLARVSLGKRGSGPPPPKGPPQAKKPKAPVQKAATVNPLVQVKPSKNSKSSKKAARGKGRQS